MGMREEETVGEGEEEEEEKTEKGMEKENLPLKECFSLQPETSSQV
jgi:hypothetical protein